MHHHQDISLKTIAFWGEDEFLLRECIWLLVRDGFVSTYPLMFWDIFGELT